MSNAWDIIFDWEIYLATVSCFVYLLYTWIVSPWDRISSFHKSVWLMILSMFLGLCTISITTLLGDFPGRVWYRLFTFALIPVAVFNMSRTFSISPPVPPPPPDDPAA